MTLWSRESTGALPGVPPERVVVENPLFGVCRFDMFMCVAWGSTVTLVLGSFQSTTTSVGERLARLGPQPETTGGPVSQVHLLRLRVYPVSPLFFVDSLTPYPSPGEPAVEDGADRPGPVGERCPTSH